MCGPTRSQLNKSSSRQVHSKLAHAISASDDSTRRPYTCHCILKCTKRSPAISIKVHNKSCLISNFLPSHCEGRFIQDLGTTRQKVSTFITRAAGIKVTAMKYIRRFSKKPEVVTFHRKSWMSPVELFASITTHAHTFPKYTKIFSIFLSPFAISHDITIYWM